jgi:glycosyltransferase involved in cell wall biosynthesis
MNLTAIILTLNEARHLPRCIQSLKAVGAAVLVVDCFSTDDTVRIAEAHGARVLQHAFVSHATQFNWALTQLDGATEWVLRLDADEYFTPALISEIRERLPYIALDVEGVYCGRRITFQGKPIRFGGVFPIRVLRLFRNGRGRCENRWMDEHIMVNGRTEDFKGEIIDDNRNSLSWWIAKHNGYASCEAADLLNLKYGFMHQDRFGSASQAAVKRWIKEQVYAHLPLGFRACVYFFYRYVLRFGFLDGATGAAFHLLQGFWYRYLVDAKIAEVERYLADHRCAPQEAIERVLNIQLLGV